MNIKLSLMIWLIFLASFIGVHSAIVYKKDTTICDKEKKRADSLQQIVFVYRLKELRTKSYLKIANHNKRESKYLLGWLNREWSE